MFSRKFLLVSLLSLSALWGCSRQGSRNFGNPEKLNSITNERVSADTSQSYALYLPVSYTKEKSYPLILLFDAHKNGTLAVEKFRKAAEIYGYILAGSNNAGNGVPRTNDIAAAIFNDVTARFNIDRKRIYTAGFSGGARIAISYAVNAGKVRGIIACSAGFSSNDGVYLAPKMDIYGIAGLQDFNYREIAAIPQMLSNTGWRQNIALFDGGHAWPPEDYVQNAVLWHHLNAMKDHLIPEEKALIRMTHDSMMISVQRAMQGKHYLEAEQKALSAISYLSSLESTKAFEDQLTEIRRKPEYKSELDKQANIRYQETELQKAYLNNFMVQDTLWWKKEISALNNEISTNTEPLYRQMYSRMKGFLGIICYSYTSNALANNDLEKTAKFLAIYRLVEPENPDSYFFKAVYLDRLGKTGAAAAALKKALEYGFTDQQKIRSSLSEGVRKVGTPDRASLLHSN